MQDTTVIEAVVVPVLVLLLAQELELEVEDW